MTVRPTWLDASSARGDELAQQGPEWLRQHRKASLSRFESLGLPTTKQEEWRATNLKGLSDAELRPATGDAKPPASIHPVARVELGGPRLVFLDGRYAPELSTPPTSRNGLWVGSLSEALRDEPERIRPYLVGEDPERSPALPALNAALSEDGAAVLVADGHEEETPIQLLFLASDGKAGLAHPRTVIAAGKGSRVRVVESYAGGSNRYFTNAVTDLIAGDNADVEHFRLQLEGPAAYHLASCRSRQGRDSRIQLHNINLGGRLVRHDVVSVLDGEGADCRLFGLYLTGDEQHVDNHTVLDHAKPHGDSRELYKGILDGKSRAVFNGRIIVRQDAQKTDAKQSNPNLLLSRGALAHTRPQLEIYADDVKCTHGATIGRIDEEAVFYLRSRGISDRDARHLLIDAFAGEVLEHIELDGLRDPLAAAVAERLHEVALPDTHDG